MSKTSDDDDEGGGRFAGVGLAHGSVFPQSVERDGKSDGLVYAVVSSQILVQNNMKDRPRVTRRTRIF